VVGIDLTAETPIRTISNGDPEIDSIRDEISKYVGQAEDQGMRYWVIIEDITPVSVIILGEEPVRLIAPVGTPLSLVKLIDPRASKDVLRGAASKAIELSKESGAKYSYTIIPAKHEEAVLQFKNAGYQELADTHEMERPLDTFYEHSKGLRFERVERDDLNGFLKRMKVYMSGSPDEALRIILGNITEMPDNFLDIWHRLEHLYLVYDGEEAVGMLDINVKEATIGNIGVAPEYRNKGYGKQIMLYGLGYLKNSGCTSARLRVHVDNEAAIHLYETLGFKAEDRLKHLIWWR
jgi:ribosomal protein S18 acetylase RimI-like enzyme